MRHEIAIIHDGGGSTYESDEFTVKQNAVADAQNALHANDMRHIFGCSLIALLDGTLAPGSSPTVHTVAPTVNLIRLD